MAKNSTYAPDTGNLGYTRSEAFDAKPLNHGNQLITSQSILRHLAVARFENMKRDHNMGKQNDFAEWKQSRDPLELFQVEIMIHEEQDFRDRRFGSGPREEHSVEDMARLRRARYR